jgi:ribosomal protein S18 acetylase RimI-like enzyme
MKHSEKQNREIEEAQKMDKPKAKQKSILSFFKHKNKENEMAISNDKNDMNVKIDLKRRLEELESANESLNKRIDEIDSGNFSDGASNKRKQIQMQLDFGQKATTCLPCKECSMPYQRGNPTDEEAHQRYHRLFMKSVHNFELKDAQCVWESATNPEERIICINMASDSCPMSHRKKAASLLELINQRLDSVDIPEEKQKNMKFYIYLSKKKLLGFVAAEKISIAYPILNYETIKLSDFAVNVSCGISRVWVHPLYRKKGIATRLLQSVW